MNIQLCHTFSSHSALAWGDTQQAVAADLSPYNPQHVVAHTYIRHMAYTCDMHTRVLAAEK